MAKAKIPAGITPEMFLEVRTQLLKVLKDLEGLKGAWVTTRLNETGRKDPSPIFVGWVEHKDLVAKRVQSLRFEGMTMLLPDFKHSLAFAVPTALHSTRRYTCVLTRFPCA